MDIKKAFEEWASRPFADDEKEFASQIGDKTAVVFYAGAKAALADPNIIDLREVWKDAPAWATEISIGFNSDYDWQDIKVIPRTAPAWTPKVGDAVFCKTGINIVCYTMVVTKIDLPSIHLTGGLSDWTMLIGDIKPFHPDHIGKSWQDIPAAPKD